MNPRPERPRVVTELGLRQTLAAIDVGRVCALDTDLRISASVGVSRHRPPQSLEDLIKNADQHMYQDKNHSRKVTSTRQEASAP